MIRDKSNVTNVVDMIPPHDPILRCYGVGRDGGNDKVLVFSFDRRPTDSEMRFLGDCMRRAAIMAKGDEHG